MKGAIMSKGYVYVLSNPAMPGLVKVGMTRGNPSLRAAQLSTTGVPENFVVEAVFCCPDCVWFEQYVHSALSEFRVSNGKEFFRISTEAIIDKMQGMHASLISEWLDEFAPTYTIVESEAFVDPSEVYFLADELDEDVEIVALAMAELRADEVRPAVERLKRRLKRTVTK